MGDHRARQYSNHTAVDHSVIELLLHGDWRGSATVIEKISPNAQGESNEYQRNYFDRAGFHRVIINKTERTALSRNVRSEEYLIKQVTLKMSPPRRSREAGAPRRRVIYTITSCSAWRMVLKDWMATSSMDASGSRVVR